MHVVITGSTSGLGLAFAIKFLQLGDKVLISSRSSERVTTVLSKLQERFGQDNVYGIACDVSKGPEIENLASKAVELLGTIDFWINNAGTTGSDNVFLVNASNEMLNEIVNTNLLGTLFGCRESLKIMLKQNFGHVVNIAGRGTKGEASEKLSAYASTKRSLDVLSKTLIKETKDSSVCIHLISPGMVMTKLLVKDNTPIRTKKIFNILAEHPTTVAEAMVPKIRKFRRTGQNLSYLSTLKAIFKFSTSFKYKNKFFDSEGNLLVSIDPLDNLA